MIKHIFTDMDKTLLNDKGQINPKTVDYLRKIDLPLTLVTARAPKEMQFAIDDLRLKGEQIAFNGGLIFLPRKDGNEVISSNPLQAESARRVIEKIQDKYEGVSVSWYTKDEWYAQQEDDGTRYETSITNIKPTLKKYDEIDYTEPIYKIMIVGTNMKNFDKVVNIIRDMNLEGVSANHSNYNYFEITNKVAVKSFGIEYIKQRDSLEKEELLAFGDGENDLKMFETVGTSVAMGNANDKVKSVATYTTLSNEEDEIVHGMKYVVNDLL